MGNGALSLAGCTGSGNAAGNEGQPADNTLQRALLAEPKASLGGEGCRPRSRPQCMAGAGAKAGADLRCRGGNNGEAGRIMVAETALRPIELAR